MKRILSFAVMIAVLVGATSLIAEKNEPEAKVGEKAPDFTLTNTEGEEVSLSDYIEEEKMVILEWMNPDCPFCSRVHKSGLVKDMIKNVKNIKENVVHIEINSTHYMGPEKTREYLDEHGVNSTALMDPTGKVGKKYGAKTTPHMFIIDEEGILRYRGAFDNDPKGKKPPKKTENYVVNAVQQIAAGKEVSPKQVKPYGCSVKYKDKQ